MRPQIWAAAETLFNDLCELPPERRDAALVEADTSDEVREIVRGMLRNADVRTSRIVHLAWDRALADTPSEALTVTAGDGPLGALPELAPGTAVGTLRIVRRIGQGGFGCVYLALDELVERHVALKVVPLVDARGNEREHKRILGEARSVARLASPHIVTLFRVHPPGEIAAWMFEMEYVEGGTLREVVDERDVLPVDEVLEVVAAIASALDVAHQRSVVHGDVKPENILVDRRGQLRLTDFGVARIIEDDARLGAVGRGIYGTPLFLSPERMRGALATAAGDVWSLGVMAYRMATGRYPFVAKSVDALFVEVGAGNAIVVPRHLDARLAALLEGCLAADPEARLQTGGAVLDFLQSAAEAPRTLQVESADGIDLFGRSDDIASVAEIVREGGKSLSITGERGVGKTSVVHAARIDADVAWIEAAVDEIDGMLRPLLGAARLRAAMQRSSGTSDALEQARGSAKRALEDEDSRRLEPSSETVWTLESLIRGLTEQTRVVVFVDDAHLATVDEIRALARIARWLASDRGALVLASRTEDDAQPATIAPLVEEGLVQELPLGGLGTHVAYDLILRRAGCARIAPGVTERLVELSHGNPLFLQELLTHLLDVGTLTVRDDELLRVPDPPDGARPVPRSLAEVVAARLATLPETDRELLDAAAVCGVQFAHDEVAALLDRDPLDALRALQRIYRATQLVEPDTDAFRFVDRASQECIYDELSAPLRRAYHTAFARRAESIDDFDLARLAKHWSAAGDTNRARELVAEYVKQNETRLMPGRLRELGEMCGILAGDVASEDAACIPELVFALAAAYFDSGDGAEARQALDAIVECDSPQGAATLAVRAAVLRSHLFVLREGAAAVDREIHHQAIERFDGSIDRAHAEFNLAVVDRLEGQPLLARDRFARAQMRYAALGSQAEVAKTLDQLGSCCSDLGDTAGALSYYERAADLARRVGNPSNAAVSEVNRAVVALRFGGIDGISDALDRAVDDIRLGGYHELTARARLVQAHLLYALGDFASALGVLQQARASLSALKARRGLSDAILTEAEWLLLAGEESPHDIEERAHASGGPQPGESFTLSLRMFELRRATVLKNWSCAASTTELLIERLADDVPQVLKEAIVECIAECAILGAGGVCLERVQRVSSPLSRRAEALLGVALALRNESEVRAAAEELAETARGSRRARIRVLAQLVELRASAGAWGVFDERIHRATELAVACGSVDLLVLIGDEHQPGRGGGPLA